jgi:hypothetical protein
MRKETDIMKSKVLMCGVLSVLLVCCFGIFGCGDTNYVERPLQPGSISGTIGAVSGDVVPNATVELTQVSTKQKFSTTSDKNGFYRFLDLADGKYILRYGKTGFVAFNVVTFVTDGLHKELSGNLLTADEISFFFGPAHPYNNQTGLVGAYVRTGKYTGLPGATVSLSPNTYGAMGYQMQDYTFDWTATSTTAIAYAMFYNVVPGNYTLTASKSGYTMSPVSYTDVPVLAGEITQVEFIPN